MQPEIVIDYLQADIDGVMTVETFALPDGIGEGDHIVVGDHDAEPAVARVLDVGPDRTVPAGKGPHLLEFLKPETLHNEGHTMATSQRSREIASEDRFRRHLRDQLVQQIRERDLDVDQLADTVGMLPSGAQALMARRDWTLGTCLRVADSLDVEVRPSLERRDASAD